jgi:hypothetical protein
MIVFALMCFTMEVNPMGKEHRGSFPWVYHFLRKWYCWRKFHHILKFSVPIN